MPAPCGTIHVTSGSCRAIARSARFFHGLRVMCIGYVIPSAALAPSALGLPKSRCAMGGSLAPAELALFTRAVELWPTTARFSPLYNRDPSLNPKSLLFRKIQTQVIVFVVGGIGIRHIIKRFLLFGHGMEAKSDCKRPAKARISG